MFLWILTVPTPSMDETRACPPAIDAGHDRKPPRTVAATGVRPVINPHRQSTAHPPAWPGFDQQTFLTFGINHNVYY